MISNQGHQENQVNHGLDMDADVTALEGELSKAREVKQGMMSMLLSGKVRLV